MSMHQRSDRRREVATMTVSARVDDGMRALLELVAGGAAPGRGPTSTRLTVEEMAHAQQIPSRFLEGILRQLRDGGIVVSRRGVDGGFRLARAPEEVTVSQVVRALDGPLLVSPDGSPGQDDLDGARYTGAAARLGTVWRATGESVRRILDHVTLAEIAAGQLPAVVHDLVPRTEQATA
jgi:Rrf2 family protein